MYSIYVYYICIVCMYIIYVYHICIYINNSEDVANYWVEKTYLVLPC